MKNENTPVIYTTYDYDMFSRMKGNRILDERNLRKLEKSMLEKQLPNPIVVNEKYEIVDGQHRLEVCTRNHLPVYYMVIPGLDETDCRKLNQDQTGWKLKDFLHYYSSLGSASAIRITELAKEFDTKPMSVVKAAGKPQDILNFHRDFGYDWFDNNLFSESDENKARERLSYISSIIEKLGGEKNVRKTTFIIAILPFMECPGVDRGRLARILEEFSHENWKLSKERMMMKIVEIYNYRKPNNFLDLVFTAGESGRGAKVVTDEKRNHWKMSAQGRGRG